MSTTTSQPSWKVREAAIEKIDAEIVLLTEQLRHLTSQRNTFTVTYTLPAKALSEIFLFSQLNCKRSPTRFDYNHPFLKLQEWLTITHVSQHWKSVALGCSQLWWEIDTLPTPAIQEFLVRSAGRGLFVDIIHTLFSRRQQTADLLAAIFSQVDRIQRLSISSTKKQFSLITPYITSSPAPKLQELILSGSIDVTKTIDLRGSAAFFQGKTPQLTVLYLSNCRIDLTSSLFSNDLTILDINRCFVGSCASWLNVLKHMPNLTHLSLRWAFTDEEDGESGAYVSIPEDFDVVPLLRLSQLNVNGPWFDSDLDFLAHISFPSYTQVELTSSISQRLPNREELTTSPLTSFLRVYTESRRDPLEIEIKSIVLEERVYLVQLPNAVEQTASTSSLRFSTHGETKAPLNLYIAGLQTVRADQAHLAELTSLPILHTTSFTTNLRIDEETWKALSDWFPNLDEISISGKAIQSFLHSLQMRPEPVSISSDPPFKPLKSIQITETSIFDLEQALTEVLVARRDGGFPMKEVRFWDCSKVYDSFIASLKHQELVEEVHCWACNV